MGYALIGDNCDLIELVSQDYLHPGDRVADVTYGKGAFWKKVDTSKYLFHPSDMVTCPKAPYDFTKLPYKNATFNAVVMDPPYRHNSSATYQFDKNYQNNKTTRGLDHDGIIRLYKAGMIEAHRILRTGGFLWVKCQDEIEWCYQRWSHIEILRIAENLGFSARDLCILTQKRKPIIQVKKQKHARKNHSYLWIFMRE
jgi:hypothetical protein